MWTVDTFATLQPMARVANMAIFDGSWKMEFILRVQTRIALNPSEANVLFDGTVIIPEVRDTGWASRSGTKFIIGPSELDGMSD